MNLNKKTTYIRLLIILSLIFLLIGCGKTAEEEDGPCPRFTCPTISSNTDFRSYGVFKINGSGDDSCARKIISDCGWHVYKGHNGGYGDTLEIAPPGEEVVLRWAWNDFNWMYLFEGWKGSTAEGARMGDTLETVKAIYPGLTYYYDGSYKLSNIGGDPSNSAYFYFKNNRLVKIEVY